MSSTGTYLYVLNGLTMYTREMFQSCGFLFFFNMPGSNLSWRTNKALASAQNISFLTHQPFFPGIFLLTLLKRYLCAMCLWILIETFILGKITDFFPQHINSHLCKVKKILWLTCICVINSKKQNISAKDTTTYLEFFQV